MWIRPLQQCHKFRCGFSFTMTFTALFVLLVSFTNAQSIPDNTIRVVDGLGRKVILGAAAQRIVTLSPHLAETVYAAGAGQQLVGVVEHSDYPEAVKQLPRIGRFDRLYWEALIRLKPDLVLLWHEGNTVAIRQRLERLNIPYYVAKSEHLDSIADLVERVGVLAGTSDLASEEARRLRVLLAAMRQQALEVQTRLSVFVQVWRQPLQTLSDKHLVSDVLNLCGADNAFAGAAAIAPVVNIESVLQKNPDVILFAELSAANLEFWQPWVSITAVKHKRFIAIDPDLLFRHGPRLLKGARLLCQQLSAIVQHNPPMVTK